MHRYTCQRCFEKRPADRCHVNHFDELLCEVCEPNAYYDVDLKRSVSWAELRLRRESKMPPGAA